MSTRDHHRSPPNQWVARAQHAGVVVYLGVYPSKKLADAAEDQWWDQHGGRRHDTRRARP